GASVAVAMVSVRVVCSAGKTTPTVGDTVIHFAPEVAVNEMGAPSVESITVCTELEAGVILSVSVEALRPRSGNGGDTTSVTGIMTGARPVTVMVTVEL